MSDDLETLVRTTEHEKVLEWRRHELIQLDFPPDAAEELAASHADLHRISDLRKRGCSPLLAFRIFRDL